ncbi:hypothetical protein [Ktedonospora formicarum]|uniref:Uncharacterized protein n=1 Tax=Ktedonospora formicarum TaxID=2778364 RepID=A0A8J3I483_9CHLR|nr:hypothetical protein [Ktedonospora formicarum]GHO49079.1 hypothetical protein KSX_72420 [Ktedonospora formicarum]
MNIPSEDKQPRNAASWAQPESHTLHVTHTHTGALTLNVDGRQITGPLQGFGQMWQKTYRVSLRGAEVSPAIVIQTWKEHFAEFWPENSRFFGPLTGIAPGEVAILNVAVGGLPLSTGVLVLYADEESFTLMTPQGHMFAGWITFSAYEVDNVTLAQVQVLIRASDPIYELGLRLGGHKIEDNFWKHTLTQLAKRFNIEGPVSVETVCVDKKIQWSQAKNIWHNSAVRTVLYTVVTPSSWFRRRPK